MFVDACQEAAAARSASRRAAVFLRFPNRRGRRAGYSRCVARPAGARGASRYLSIIWPEDYVDPGSHWSADQLLAGFQELGIDVELSDVPQPSAAGVVVLGISVGRRPELVAFDHADHPDIDEHVAESVLVYFKEQFRNEGYEQPNVVAGGYVPASVSIYRYLPLLRALRRSRQFRWDVYGRFGMKWGGQEARQRAHDLLSARADFVYEGSLFRYPGGPDALPYRKHLFEIPRAKVCVDMPGQGDLTTRFLDYLAIGACVVKPPPQSRLPVRLVDGVHVPYCSRDLSDLGDVCAQLVRDDETRETIALNARDFFDRPLHRRQLAARYVDAITDARAEAQEQAVVQETPAFRPHPARRPPLATIRPAFRYASVAVFAAILAFVALPEALGDHPYDARPSQLVRELHERP
jgi:hypothetical protein